MLVSETSSTPIGQSLSRVGQGTSAFDFTWSGPSADSPGAPNAGQVFEDACGPPAAVPAPTDLAGQTCGGFVQLTWSPVSTAQLAGYDVYRSTFSGSGYAKLTTTPVPTPDYLDTSTVAGVDYFYVVTTVDSVLGESSFSTELTIQAMGGGATTGQPWINEFHYDDVSTDSGEFVEVAGPAGLDLSGYELIGYNGANGLEYTTVALGGIVPSEAGCVGAVSFAFPGLQNGGPDGIALVDPQGVVVEFLSYEGSFSPIEGPADGMPSVDVGVSESSSTPEGFSLQRAGSGASAVDFPLWQSAQAETPGGVNAGQTFSGGCGSAATPTGCGVNPVDQPPAGERHPQPRANADVRDHQPARCPNARLPDASGHLARPADRLPLRPAHRRLRHGIRLRPRGSPGGPGIDAAPAVREHLARRVAARAWSTCRCLPTATWWASTCTPRARSSIRSVPTRSV